MPVTIWIHPTSLALTMAERRPAFQCYASDDVLANGDVAELSHEAFGVFWRLYCRAWLEDGIPNDLDRLARWARMDREHFGRLWEEMRHLWEETEDASTLRCSSQEEKRARVEAYSASRRANGLQGGRPRREDKPCGNHMVSAREDSEKHMQSSPSPPPSSSPPPNKKALPTGEQTRAPARDETPPLTPPSADATASLDRADKLVAWWIRHRKEDSPPPDSAKKKQGAVAALICAERNAEDIRRAISGMAKMFPYSNGEPWDLLDLRRVFDKALQAERSPPTTNGNGKKHDAESWRVRREGDGRGTEDDPAFNFPIPEF